MANFRETNMASLKEEWAILFQGPNRISRDESNRTGKNRLVKA